MGRTLEIISVILPIFSVWFTIGIYAAYLPLYAFYALGASNLLVGLLATIYFGVNAPLSIAVGYLTDRYRKVRFTLVTALLSLSLANFLTIYINDPKELLLIRVIQGFSSAAIIPLSNLLGSELFGPGRGVGIVSTFGSLGFLLSSFLGGILLNYYTFQDLFIIAAVVPVPAIFTIMSFKADILRGGGAYSVKFSYIRKLNRPIWIMYFSIFLRQLAAAGIWSLFSLYIYNLGGDSFIVGLAFALNTVTQVTIFEKVGKISEGRGMLVFKIGLLLSSIVFFLYYIIDKAILILPIQVLLGVAWTTLYSGINVYIIENTPEDIRGTSLGLVGTMLALGWILGSVLAGLSADIFGNYKTYILSAGILTFIALIFPQFSSLIIIKDDLRSGS